MRTLKFRVWDKAENKWLLGYDYPDLGGFSLFGEMVLVGEFAHVINIEKLSNDDYAVMQFTGLKDKNGKEIYEGDVIQIDAFYENIPHYPTDNQTDDLIGIVKYVNGSFEADSVPLYVFYETNNPELEIIGNIHENPDLLDSNV